MVTRLAAESKVLPIWHNQLCKEPCVYLTSKPEYSGRSALVSLLTWTSVTSAALGPECKVFALWASKVRRNFEHSTAVSYPRLGKLHACKRRLTSLTEPQLHPRPLPPHLRLGCACRMETGNMYSFQLVSMGEEHRTTR